ncbi:hypothetical protein ACTXT7_004969 [Hymenolepis weldensis]
MPCVDEVETDRDLSCIMDTFVVYYSGESFLVSTRIAVLAQMFKERTISMEVETTTKLAPWFIIRACPSFIAFNHARAGHCRFDDEALKVVFIYQNV